MHGINTDVPGPIVAFVAFKLSQLLAYETWNKAGARVDEDNVATYNKYLQQAVSVRGIVIRAELDGNDEQGTWIRVVYDVQVAYCPACFHVLPVT